MTLRDYEQEKWKALKSLLLTLAIGLWIWWLWSRRNLYRFAYKLPGIFGLPILGIFGGHIIDPKKQFMLFEKIFEEFKSYTVCIWMGIKPVMLISDPNTAEKLLSNKNFLHAPEFYRPVWRVLGGSLLAASSDIWRHNRKVMLPFFGHKVLLGFFPIFHKTKMMGIAKFGNMVGKGEHQLRDMLRRLGLGISLETITGYALKEGDKVDEDLVNNITTVLEGIYIGVIYSFLNLDWLHRYYFTYAKAIRNCSTFLNQVVHAKLKSRAEVKKNPELLKVDEKAQSDDAADSFFSIKKVANTFVDQAIDSYEKKLFKWKDIFRESGTLIIASFETSTSLLHTVIVMLALHPECQERLFEELVNYYPDKDFEMKCEDIKDLPYLTMVINECLRLVPPIPFYGRHIIDDIPLDENLMLPKGLEILIDVFHLHRRTDLWGPNAEKFNPDNFLPENLKDKHSYAFLPFSKGFRNCMGYRYAYHSISVLLSGFVRNFRFTTTFKYEDLSYFNDILINFLKEPGIEVHRREA